MLLPDNLNPENSIYYNGSFVIKSLTKIPRQNFFSLYEEIKKTTEMSISTYTLCIDWLFLIDAVSVNEGGEITLCT